MSHQHYHILLTLFSTNKDEFNHVMVWLLGLIDITNYIHMMMLCVNVELPNNQILIKWNCC